MQSNSTLADSRIGKLLQKLSFPVLSEFLILTSVFLFWYEGALPTYNLAAVVLVLSLVCADKSKITITKAINFLVGFITIALFSGLVATWRGIDAKLILMGWALLAQFLVAILAAQGVAKPLRLIRNVIYLSVPMTLVGAYQYLANQPTSSLWVSAVETGISTRAFAFFGSPNVLGAVLAMIALVATGLYLDGKNKLMLAISALSAVVLVFTFSRSAWLGLSVAVLVILVIRNSRLVLLTPLAAIALFIPQVWTRVSVVFTSGYWLDSSLDGRLWALNNGFHIWAKHPVFGTGPGTYGGKLALSASSPVYLESIQRGYVALYFTDNQWLQLLVQMGLAGVILFVLFVVNVFVELLRRYNKSGSWTTLGILGAFVAFLATGFFGNVLEFGAIAVPVGIMLGVGLSE